MIDYLNMMIPPIKVTQSEAPQEVAKLRRCASLMTEIVREDPSDFVPMTSGTKMIPATRKARAVTKREVQAMTKLFLLVVIPNFQDLNLVLCPLNRVSPLDT